MGETKIGTKRGGNIVRDREREGVTKTGTEREMVNKDRD